MYAMPSERRRLTNVHQLRLAPIHASYLRARAERRDITTSAYVRVLVERDMQAAALELGPDVVDELEQRLDLEHEGVDVAGAEGFAERLAAAWVDDQERDERD